MELISQFSRILPNYMFRSATAYIYSSPVFTLETVLLTIVCTIYVFLHLEIANITLKTCNLKPNSLFLSNRLRAVISRASDCTSITRVQERIKFSIGKSSSSTRLSYNRLTSTISSHSNGELAKPQNAGDVFYTKRSGGDLTHRIDTVLSMTPEDYIKNDYVRKAKENELVNCIKSLSTLYQDAVVRKVSRQTTHRHLELAKEHLEQAKISSDTARYLGRNADALTSSLFDLLEGIIMTSAPERPLPFKGDLTTLIFDAGNLNMKSSVGCNIPQIAEA